MARINRILDSVWEAFRYLFLTPSWGSKHRVEHREYEERLDEAMERCCNEERVTNQ